MKSGTIQPFSVTQINRTAAGYTEIRQGFDPATPNVGTLTHEFHFRTDPWQINSTAGNVLCTLSAIKLSVSKVFNPNNNYQFFLCAILGSKLP